MQNQERLLAFIKTTENGNECKLCITDTRFVVIGKKSSFFSAGLLVGGALGGAVGSVICDAIQTVAKKRDTSPIDNSEKLEISMINDLLEKDWKHTYAIPYDGLIWAALNKGWRRDNLNVRSKKEMKEFELTKEQSSQLLQILPNIDGLKGKFNYNK